MSDIYDILNLKSCLKGYALTLIKETDVSIAGNKEVCFDRLKNRFSRVEFIRKIQFRRLYPFQNHKENVELKP